MLDLQNDLNEQQAEAVLKVNGPLLVIAGAGSGKTRVITYRVAHLVENKGIAPYRILAVTFTNKAAREMRERIMELLGGAGADCWVSTFHAVCAKLLRLHAEWAGVDKQFTIYDNADQKAMVSRCLKTLDFDSKQFPPKMIQSAINKAKRELVTPSDYPTNDFYRERIQQVYAHYEERMKEASALDFGDLIYRMVMGMRSNEEFRRVVSRRFEYLLADEFQDTNSVQLEFIRLLAEEHSNICVVGDDDQSIYSWRGADVTNILEFEHFFPGAHVVTLDRNYRSTSNILKGAHGVVSQLKGRREKELWTSDPDGENIAYIETEDEREEARLVTKAIKELKEDGYSLKEQAVFYRINAQSRVFEEVFRSMDIPYKVVGGMRFYERAEVKDVLAYLRLIQNTSDLSAFLRVVNTPTRGIGKTTIDKLMSIVAGYGISAYDAIERAGESVGSAGVKRLTAFRGMVEKWRAEIEQGPVHLARRVLEDTGYMQVLENENTAEADARMENLRELEGSLEDFEKEAKEPSLSSFLELIALQTDVDQVDFGGETVTLMTVHAAKGLEFEVVYVTGLEEDLFPYRSGAESQPDDSFEEMEEERRLCYVAMTRARKRLFLTRARVRRLFGRERYNCPSRFIDDVPMEIITDLSINRRPGAQLLSSYSSTRSKTISARSKKKNANRTRVDSSFDQSSTVQIRRGQKVRNAKFGIGEVVSVRFGERVKVEVLFPVYGKKVVLADFLDFE